MTASAPLRSQGFDITAKDGRLIVAPASRLTDDLRAYIHQHKAAILAELIRNPIADAAHRHGLTPRPNPRFPRHPCHRRGSAKTETRPRFPIFNPQRKPIC